MSDEQVSGVLAGLEVGLPTSIGTSISSARKPVPSYVAPLSMQDGMSQHPYSRDGRFAAAGEGYSQPRRNPRGLGPLAYGMFVAVIAMVIVGTALGGGLGGNLAASQNNWYVLHCNTLVRKQLGMAHIHNTH